MVRTQSPGEGTGRRQIPADRHANIELIRKSAETVLPNIDGILERFDGKRLANVDTLGCVPIETTVAGIKALAASDHVKAILEDQPISLLSAARR